MRKLFHVLKYTRPAARYLIPYIIFTVLSVFFGILNFTLLVPVLNILFSTQDMVQGQALIEPSFNWSIQYFISLFNYTIQHIILTKGKVDALIFVAFSIVSSVFLSNLFKIISLRSIETLKAQTEKNLRKDVYSRILDLDVSYFSNNRKGDLITKVTTDVGEIQVSIISTLSVIFKEPVTLILFFITLFAMSYKLTLFTFLVIPVSGLTISLISKSIKRDAKKSFDISGQMMTILDETINGIKVIKSFNAGTFFKDRFLKANDTFSKLLMQINLRKELASSFSEFAGVTMVSLVLTYGGWLVITNNSELSASEFITYIVILSQLLRPAKAISTSLSGIQKGLVAVERITDLLSINPEIERNTTEGKKISALHEDIVFENVSFWHGEKIILNNISLRIEKGKMVALVGPSGGGKSTLSDLLPRFYDPQAGRILIDGVDMRDINIFSLRNMIGLVGQESMLLNDSIYNNIVFGKENVSQAEVEQAARIANAHEFIIKTESGYQTNIGDRGLKLSGGQKQRLSIARAILRNPPILILDEATSALDTESEKLVQNALDNLMKNRTTLVIAHRLSTIQHADAILVVKDGEIVESGSHEELLNIEQGIYLKLSTMQA